MRKFVNAFDETKPPPPDASVKKSDGGREGDTFEDFDPDPPLGGTGVHVERYNFRSGRLSPHRRY